MKKLLCIVPCALCLCAPARAGVAIDFYAGLSGGLGGMWANSNNAASQSYGAMMGIDIPLIRVEAEYDYLRRTDLNAHVGMLNGYIKMPMPVIKPYIGGGIGQVFGGEAGSINLDSTTAYQGMLGVQIEIPAAPIVLDAETRVLYANDILPGVDMTQWDARLKLRYMF